MLQLRQLNGQLKLNDQPVRERVTASLFFKSPFLAQSNSLKEI